MATFAHKCALLGELYSLQDLKGFKESEEFTSYLQEHSLVLAISVAIQDELVDANPTSENLIERAFEDLAELWGMDSDQLGSHDSIRDVMNFEVFTK